MILTDDNFATIVKAIEYGRALYDNLSNYIRFQMATLVAFIAAFLLASLLGISGGVPFGPLIILWINFLIQVPIGIALGFDKPSPGLMAHKPRPLSHPVLSLSQWVRIAALGLIAAVGTLALEAGAASAGTAVAVTMAYAAFSLYNIWIGISARSEFGSAFNREILSDRRQLGLFGLALLLTFLGTELSFLQRILGTASLTLDQWLLCFAASIALLLFDEVIKFFLRRRHKKDAVSKEYTSDPDKLPVRKVSPGK
jgi:Ca2+-transporting ATPase